MSQPVGDGLLLIDSLGEENGRDRDLSTILEGGWQETEHCLLDWNLHTYLVATA